MKSAALMLSAVSALALAACGADEPTTSAPTDPAVATDQQQVERIDPAAATPPPVITPATVAIQTQDATDGIRVALTRASVTGDVLTVQTTYSKPSEGSAGLRFPVETVNVIDDATAQRYGVLRDSTGRWQASPLESAGSNFISFGISQGDTEVVWFKFPAPPATSQTVSINIPNVGPFDGVPVSR